MPTLINEIISVRFFLFSFSLTLLVLWLLIRFKVLDSWVDPTIATFFQLLITFFGLSYLSILPLRQIIVFIIFIEILLFARLNLKPIKAISTTFWMQFSYFLLIIVIVLNVFITIKKGFIYLAEDPGEAKLLYYQGYGLFQRINHLSAPIFAINSFYLLRANKKVLFYLYLIVCFYLIITLGSKGSLLGIIFFYGAYYKFHRDTESIFIKRNKGKLAVLIVVLFLTSLGMFYLIFKDDFLNAFVYRMIAFSDGPFYFYYGNLQEYISYSPMYMFDQLFVILRIHPDLQYMGLGAKINYYYFNYYDLLNGPNPQIFVESRVLFGSFFWVMYLMTAFLFLFLRKLCATPITFYFVSFFVATLFIDSQYALAQLFDYLLLASLMLLFWCIKKVIAKSTAIDKILAK
jgi:hypothetical protein